MTPTDASVPKCRRVGVIGCGLIAQTMHLPYLAELDDLFEIAGLCDVSENVLESCSRRYGVERTFTDWEELMTERLDAVLVLTSGNHAPIAVTAANAGMHVFVEKPMAISAAEGARMVSAAEASGVRLMVGTMKRYDPAYARLRELLADLRDIRLVRVTTLESPLEPYVRHYQVVRATEQSAVDAPTMQDERHLDAALGAGADDTLRWCYRNILLDNLVHELNLLRGALGEPSAVTFAGLDRGCALVSLSFGDSECHLSWVDLPGIARYRQEFAFYAPDRRVTLTFPSPFLRSAPSRLTIEGGKPGTAHAWQRDEVASYEEAFRRELVAFHESITTGREPPTSGTDGFRDLLLCEAIAHVHLSGDPVESPTSGVPATLGDGAG